MDFLGQDQHAQPCSGQAEPPTVKLMALLVTPNAYDNLEAFNSYSVHGSPRLYLEPRGGLGSVCSSQGPRAQLNTQQVHVNHFLASAVP